MLAESKTLERRVQDSGIRGARPVDNRVVSRNDREVIGGGLLRLLADTLVLEYATRHIAWIGASLRRVDGSLACYPYGTLALSVDRISHRVLALGMQIPTHLTELCSMSSITPMPPGVHADAAVLRVAAGHEAVLNDIDTLLVTLPLDADNDTAILLADLRSLHLELIRVFRLDPPAHGASVRDATRQDTGSR